MEAAANIVADGFGQRVVYGEVQFGARFFHGGEHGGFQAGKTHLQIVAVQHGARKGECVGRTEFGVFGQERAGGIRQADEFAGFVEGFASRVVHRFAQKFVIAEAAHGHELRVAARYEQGDEGECRLLFRQQRRKQVAFQMVHGQDGFAQCEGQRVGISRTGQQRAAQAGALRVGNRVDVGILHARFLQSRLRERHEPADVVAAGQFGHHAAIFGVHGHLGV